MINLAIIGLVLGFILMIIAFLRKSLTVLFIAGTILLIFGIFFLSTGETMLNQQITTELNSSYTLKENVYSYQRDAFSNAFSLVSILMGILCYLYFIIQILRGKND